MATSCKLYWVVVLTGYTGITNAIDGVISFGQLADFARGRTSKTLGEDTQIKVVYSHH